MAKFLFVTDLHGNRKKYERSLDLARETGARLIVNGGDMFPHGRMHEEQARFVREFLDGHFAACQKKRIRYLAMAANDDLRAHDALLDEVCARYPLVTNIAGQRVAVDGYDFIGFNLVTDFPFRLKDRARMDSRNFVFPPQFGSGILSVPGGWEEKGQVDPGLAILRPDAADDRGGARRPAKAR
ncbi:MAG: metallophosphoesterase [Deltaproteobacteria bacterium]|nr:metallophosphoesterase [Deltaproteobacteria bacterium]